MSNNTKEIKRRIKSINNTRKITKAMALVAATKMRRAVDRVLASRSYANVSWETLLRLSQRVDPRLNALLHQREKIENIAIIVISSNRGLCGGFNSNIINQAIKTVQESEKQVKHIDIITVGKKGYQGLLKFNWNMKVDLEKKDITTSMADIYHLSNLIIEEYKSKMYDKILVVYTDFVSALRHIPRTLQLLPLELKLDKDLGVVHQHDLNEEHFDEDIKEYVLEPSPQKLLDEIVQKIIEIKLFQVFLESDAAEHSARMLAMKNASEVASEMIDSLRLEFNKARQASITQEISEISGGKEVLDS